MNISGRGSECKTFGQVAESYLQKLYIESEVDTVEQKIELLKRKLEINEGLAVRVDGKPAGPLTVLRCLEFELLESEQLISPMYC